MSLIKPYQRVMSVSSCLRKVVFCLALCPALLVGQGLNPQGIQYSIAGSLPGNQLLPHVAVNAASGYMVWEDNSVTSLGRRIRLVALDGNCRASGSPLVVSSAYKSKATGEQEKPKVALLQSGGAVVVWAGGKPGNQDIYARFLGANQTFINKNDIRVNTFRKTYATTPAVTVLADGSVVVVWASDRQDGDKLGIFGQRLSSTGAKLGKEFQINREFGANNQRTPTVAALANGNFVVTWISELQRGAAMVDVCARIFDPSGNPIGNEFVVNDMDRTCANPAVAASGQGGFFVAWSQNDQQVYTLGAGLSSGGVLKGTPPPSSTNSWDIVGRLFESDGTTTNASMLLNSHRYGDQYVPEVSALGSRYLAVWTSLGQDGSWEGIYGRLVSRDGVQGEEFRANTTTLSKQFQPAVAADSQNRFLVIWSSYVVGGLNFDLFAQLYQTTGE